MEHRCRCHRRRAPHQPGRTRRAANLSVRLGRASIISDRHRIDRRSILRRYLILARVLESTLNRPFPKGKMTPTRLELGGVPCLLVLRNASPFPAEAEQELRPQIILLYYGHGSRLIRVSLRRVHTQPFVRNDESVSHLEWFHPSIGFDTEPCRLRTFL
jgi:hypothetical protein